MQLATAHIYLQQQQSRARPRLGQSNRLPTGSSPSRSLSAPHPCPMDPPPRLFYPPPLTPTSTTEDRLLNSDLNPWKVPEDVLACRVPGGGRRR